MKQLRTLLSGVCAAVVLATPVGAATADWIAASDRNTDEVTALFAKYLPEIMGRFGVKGVDEEIQQLPLDLNEKAAVEELALVEVLRERLEAETQPAVRQDLAILIDVLERDLELTELRDSLMLPYFNVAEMIFRGLIVLLDDQIPVERRRAAVVRLRRYAGMEEGYSPLTEQAEAYTRARLENPDLIGPYRLEVEQDLARAGKLVPGIESIFQKYEIEGYEESYAALLEQFAAYHDFVEQEILPRAREDYRIPMEIYAENLKELGVDMEVPELVSRAKVSFKEIQNEMQAIAALMAKEVGRESADYRDVIRDLLKKQLIGEEIMTFYTDTIAEVEKIIEREQVATLPQRPLRTRIAGEAEAEMYQAATIRWPQLLGEVAEVGEIILPLTRAATDGSEDATLDDFTSESAAWSLVIHEGRPGHEMQMAAMLETGVSKARAAYAFNSTNVEGWALYAEAEMKPYLALDAQLISLQHRLLRAARAFLDPGLQLGEISEDEAMRVLTEEVVLSVPLAEQEVERYTIRDPGQATSYFCGYSRLLEIRADAERTLGADFDRRAFNDFILTQGLVPSKLLRQAVEEQFIPASR